MAERIFTESARTAGVWEVEARNCRAEANTSHFLVRLLPGKPEELGLVCLRVTLLESMHKNSPCVRRVRPGWKVPGRLGFQSFLPPMRLCLLLFFLWDPGVM